jgi:4-hydroxythreonine-4-phosphate dehydrogenase
MGNIKPKIGFTIGDQAGVGLELIEKTIPVIKDICEYEIIGEQVKKPVYGKVNPEYGYIAGQAINDAITKARNNEIDAVVTAPINKESFNLGGWDYPGHTEMFATLFMVRNYAMMLVHQGLRVVHVTTHIPLRDIFEFITVDRIVDTIRLAYQGCVQLGVKEPVIAVSGLNPHSSDGGLFGTEETTIIRPAIDKAREYGYKVIDHPIPADTVFAKALGGAYDCVVAMYHDQGHIPIKTVGFQWCDGWKRIDGVNITLGLPIIRTSPDHGVAFGKAGKGTADPTSMVNAVRLAVRLAENRKVFPENWAKKE